MEVTDGAITSVNDDYTVEQTLFTYSEEERQEQKFNKVNADLIWRPEFFYVDYEMLHSGFSLLETALYGFIKFFLKNNEKFYCSSERLAEMFCVSSNTIDNTLKRLKEGGVIDYSSKPKVKGGKVRFVRLTESENPNHKNLVSDISEPQNLGFAEPQNLGYIKNKYIENKKRNKKEKKSTTSDKPTMDELLEAYKNDERLSYIMEDDLVTRIKYKFAKKQYYATTKSFCTYLVTLKKEITFGKVTLDLTKRFSFAVDIAIASGWDGIHWYEDTEKKYLAAKKDLFPNP